MKEKNIKLILTAIKTVIRIYQTCFSTISIFESQTRWRRGEGGGGGFICVGWVWSCRA